MVRRLAWLLLLASRAAPAFAGNGVGSAIDALGGLRGPLEAEGWSLATDRNTAISPGDVYDPADHQVQVLGKACFGADRIRSGLAPSMDLDRTLTAKGKVKFGFWGVSAGGNANIDAQISKAEIAEIAVADLKPTEACARQLQGLVRAGQNVGSWVVVQSTLTTDLDLKVCGGGSVGIVGTPAGELSVGADQCRKTSGTSLVLAIRPEPLAAVLADAGIALPTAGAPPKKPERRKGRPCWLDGPCLPYVHPTFETAVGRGSTIGAADNAARAALLDPYQRQHDGLDPILAAAGGPAPLSAADAVVIADRFSDDQGYYSLLAVDRAALQARLQTETALAETALAMPADPGPLGEVQALTRSLPIAAQLVGWRTELAVLSGGEPATPAEYVHRVEQRQVAVAALAVKVPVGTNAAQVATALTRAGYKVAPDGPLELRLIQAAPKSKDIQGFTSITLGGTLELRAGDQLVSSVDVEGSASSQDKTRAKADAEAALWAKVAEAGVQLLNGALE